MKHRTTKTNKSIQVKKHIIINKTNRGYIYRRFAQAVHPLTHPPLPTSCWPGSGQRARRRGRLDNALRYVVSPELICNENS